MIAGLQFTYLYHDFDIIEVRIVAQNDRFRGTADVYVDTGSLIEAATLLSGFPANPQDTRELTFGAFGPNFAGGAVRLEFFCRDGAGHSVIRVTMEADAHRISTVRDESEEDAENATLRIDFDPAALDRFLIELQKIEKELAGTAVLETENA